MANKATKYHHGDLRTELIQKAIYMIESQGFSALSMRTLGELIGVSRTALYHHFSNKDDLLSAIAEFGFSTWQTSVNEITANNTLNELEKLHAYVFQYLTFAVRNKAIYDLMFGNTLWQQPLSFTLKNTDTLKTKSNDKQSLKQTAYNSFISHVNLIKHWQQAGIIDNTLNALRLAQVTWSTLHGMARLFNDGIYVETKNIDELCETIVNVFKQ